MQVALEVWSSNFKQVEATCLLAESLGIDAFYYGESPHDLNLDCWTTLGALAQSTERIRLGPVITNVLPTYRSNALLAKQAATVASISNDRLDFRTGVGAAASFGRQWWEPFGVAYQSYEQRLTDLETALFELPDLWSKTQTASPIPITIAARGSRAMVLAATYGDVWETSFCTPAEFMAQEANMSEARGEQTITRALEIDAFVATNKSGVDRVLKQVRADRGTDEDLDPVFARALTGVPEDAAGHLCELSAVGVDQVTVALHDPHSGDAVEAIAEAAAIVREERV